MEQGLDYDKLLLRTDPIVKTIAVEIELFHGGDQVNNIMLYLLRMKKFPTHDHKDFC